MVTRTAAAPRYGTQRNEARTTLGQYLANIGETLGTDFYPWQQMLSDVSMELDPRDRPTDQHSTLRLHYQYVGALVGRQSGKTLWAVARVLAQCLLPNDGSVARYVGVPRFLPQKVAYTAQSRTVATQKWQEHVEMMLNSDFSHLIKKAVFANGKECCYFHNGSQYFPVTPSRTGARGLTLDLCIVDEALAHPLWLLQVLRPTMAQRDNAAGCLGTQFVVISNAGDDDSEMLNRLQELGIKAIDDPDSKRAWFEWSMKPGADPLLEETWLDTMPTLEQPNGISLDFLRLEAETMRLDQFMREYLCHRTASSDNALFTHERWFEMYRTDILIPFDVVLAVDLPMDRSRAALVAVGAAGSYLPIEIVDAREGTEWLLDRTTDVANRHTAPVVIDAGGPAASLIPALEQRNVQVIPIAVREVANAAAMFYDAFQVKRLCHMNDYRLNDAVTGASKRAVGERWAFDRRGYIDISPLVAASFGVWAIETGQLAKPTIY